MARIAQAYLSKRNEILRTQNLFGQHSTETASRGDGTSVLGEGLGRVLELVESPLQKMKRAGLGLLSQGLGRYAYTTLLSFLVYVLFKWVYMFYYMRAMWIYILHSIMYVLLLTVCAL